MSDWLNYAPTDLLLFSPRVYYRQIELFNRAVWPLHLIVVVAAIGMMPLLLRPARWRAHWVICAPTLLGLAWLWIAWAYFWQRYATINWAALWIAPCFALQGVLLLLVASLEVKPASVEPTRALRCAAFGVFLVGVIGYPLLAAVSDRPWQAAEVVGIAPDPTAIATLPLLMAFSNRWRWALMIIPSLWCAMTGVTLWTMGMSSFFIAPASAVAILVLAFITEWRGTADRATADHRHLQAKD